MAAHLDGILPPITTPFDERGEPPPGAAERGLAAATRESGRFPRVPA